MQAFKAATTVDSHRRVRIEEVPFRPGARVEVIILEPATASSEKGAMTTGPQRLSPSRQAALDRILGSSYRLGGTFPNRDELHER